MPALPLRQGAYVLSEYPDSPDWLFEETTTCTRRYHGPAALVWAATPGYRSAGTGAQTGMTVLRARCKPTGDGSEWELTVTYEGPKRPDGSAPAPPNPEISVEYEWQSQPMQRHPRWADLFEGDIGRRRKQAIARLLKTPPTMVSDGGTPPHMVEETNENQWIYKIGEPDYDTDVHECYKRMCERELTYRVQAPVVRINSFSLLPPTPSGGDYLEAPPDDVIPTPEVPWGEWIWIRNSDKLTFSGSWWVLVQSWSARPWVDEGLYATSGGTYS